MMSDPVKLVCVSMTVIVLLVLILIPVMLFINTPKPQKSKSTRIQLEESAVHGGTRFMVLTDTRTGKQYLANYQGGIVALNTTAKPEVEEK